MEPNPYQATNQPRLPPVRQRQALSLVFAIGLPLAMYVGSYVYMDIAPTYGMSGDGSATTRIYRWRWEAIAFKPLASWSRWYLVEP